MEDGTLRSPGYPVVTTPDGIQLGGATGCQAREILDGRGNKEDVARALGVHPFVAEKTSGQANRFSIETLENIYHRLLSIDERVKTSKIKLDLPVAVGGFFHAGDAIAVISLLGSESPLLNGGPRSFERGVLQHGDESGLDVAIALGLGDSCRG